MSQRNTTPFDQVILITGGRDWTNYTSIYDALIKWKGKRVCLIHGDCRGADRLADAAAEAFRFTIHKRIPDWKTFGRAAGIYRNIEMLQEAIDFQQQGVPTIVLAFHDNLEESKGTKHCVEQAKKKGLDVILYTT